MKSYFKLLEKVKNQAGATAVIVAITLPMLIGFTALAVDVGYMHVTKNELQNVADAAALAAARKLGTIYQGMTHDAQQTYSCGDDDIGDIKDVANAVAHNNKAGGEHITVYAEGIDHVEIGVWNPSNTPPFTPFTTAPPYPQPDAVRVTAHRDNAANGPITTFFAKIFGIDAVDVSADATAALLGQTTSEPGEIELPLGISTLAATPERCDKDIKFSPTTNACAGWNSFFEKPTSEQAVRDILIGMRAGTIESPETTAGVDKLEYNGGKLSTPTFNAILLLFKDRGYDIKADGTPVQTYEEGHAEEGQPITGHLGDVANVVPLWLTDIDGNLIDINGNLILDPDSSEKVPIYYPDDDVNQRNKHEWPTKVVVYYNEKDEPPDKCSNPVDPLLIVGYADILLTDVINKSIKGKLECEHVSDEDTRGGGGEYGTKGSIPCLVE